MSRVTITYIDTEALTVEEIVKRATDNYGNFAKIDIAPESNMAYDHIYFGLQQLITYKQLEAFFDKSQDYHTELNKLREKIIEDVTEIVDQVIVDNESKVS